jgi:hypothetical protein
MVWDNGGATEVCNRYGILSGASRDSSQQVVNLGKAGGLWQLRTLRPDYFEEAGCYVCMDDDVIVDAVQLDALVKTALRPGLGMIGACWHPFNSTMPTDVVATTLFLDPYPQCTPDDSGRESIDRDMISLSGMDDPNRPCLKVFPASLRTEQKRGMLAGTLFAISRDTVARLPWAPFIYPVIGRDGKPFIYWPEDGFLDIKLTELGFTNGYLATPGLIPAIHLPELNQEYTKWKIKHYLSDPQTENPFF